MIPMPALFIQHRAPFDGVNAVETLDALLVQAAFGLEPAVLFVDDGVWQLVGPQAPAAIGAKSVAAQQEALPMYDVTTIHVERESLESRGLGPDDLVLPVQLVSRAGLADLFSRHAPILRF